MKRSFPVNLNNTIFYIDEDAYNLLTDYFEQLRSAFPGEDGKETIADIESRVGELMSEKAGNGSIITLPLVNEVIGIMGSPEQLGATKSAPSPEPVIDETACYGRRKLYRDIDNRVLGGVLSGMAIRYDWNLNILRVLVIFIGLFTGVFPVMAIYLIAWMVIPAATTMRQRLEMKGEPVNVETVSQTVSAGQQPTTPADTLGCIINILVKCALGFAAFMAVLIGGAALIGAIVCLLTALGYAFGSPEWMESTFDVDCGNMPAATLLGGMSALLAIIIPSVAVIWTACVVFFKSKGASRTIIISACVIEIIAIVAAIVLISMSERANDFCDMITCC